MVVFWFIYLPLNFIFPAPPTPNAQAQNPQAQNPQAQNVQAQNVQAQNVQAQNAQARKEVWEKIAFQISGSLLSLFFLLEVTVFFANYFILKAIESEMQSLSTGGNETINTIPAAGSKLQLLQDETHSQVCLIGSIVGAVGGAIIFLITGYGIYHDFRRMRITHS